MRRASSFLLLAALAVPSWPEPSLAAGLRGAGFGAPRPFTAAGPRGARGIRFGSDFASGAFRGHRGAFHRHGRGLYGPFGYGWGDFGWGRGGYLDGEAAPSWREPDTGVVAATGIRPPPVGEPVIYVLHPERDAVAQWRASRARAPKILNRTGRGGWSNPSHETDSEWGGAGARVIHLRVAKGS
jgi:hypothetical protein